jgi:hypothetical protein
VGELNLQVVASSGVNIDELHLSTDTKDLVKGQGDSRETEQPRFGKEASLMQSVEELEFTEAQIRKMESLKQVQMLLSARVRSRESSAAGS